MVFGWCKLQRRKVYFFWGDSEEYARVLSKKSNEKIRFQWINGESDEEDYFFEFKIQMDEITKDVSLIITDFSEEDDEEDYFFEFKIPMDEITKDVSLIITDFSE